jgi:hypothetical protein
MPISVKSMSFVKKLSTENTGGGVMCDFITLDDETILVVSDELICLYKDMEAFEAGEVIGGFIYRNE